MDSLHFSSKSNEWDTPQSLYDLLNKYWNFTLDPCTNGSNSKCNKGYTGEEDGLTQSWLGETVFMNPPYGREIKHWLKKAKDEWYSNNVTTVCLVPARTCTSYWHNHVFNLASTICFISGRLKFGDSKNSAPFPSALVVYGMLPKFNIGSDLEGLGYWV